MEFLLGFELEFQSSLTMSRTREALQDKFGLRFQIDPGPRNYNLWHVVRDGSIRPLQPKDWGRHPVELVSPVFDYNVGLDYIRRLFEWVDETEGGTNASTGFHVGLSIKDANIADINKTKLIMLLDEDGILGTFDRIDNEYCRSQKYTISKFLQGGYRKPWSEKLISDVAERTDKYHTVNFRKLVRFVPYLEFRAMGGENYHRRFADIRRTIEHFKDCVEASMGKEQDEKYSHNLQQFALE